MYESNGQDGQTKNPRFLLRILAVGICLLATVLIIQVVLVVRSKAPNGSNTYSETESINIDGQHSQHAQAIITCGFVEGLEHNGSFAFLGIPYAIPPLGLRRWAKSEIHTKLEHCWSGTYKAQEWRKPCWQFYRNGSYDGSEDCLYLNVFTPKFNLDDSLDVVVFVGGETLDGGENLEVQPGPELAKLRNCVFVTVSIRRSILGFYSLGMLPQSPSVHTSGNFGLSDLLTALLWVQYNIRHFGGNPGRVTLLGHQSGASLLSALLRRRVRNDLFHQMWISGGSFLEPIGLEVAAEQNHFFLEQTDCETVQCLYTLSPEELLEGVPYDWRQFYQDLQPFTLHETNHQWLVLDGEILGTKTDENVDVPKDIPVVLGAPMHLDASSEMRMLFDWNSTEKYQEHLDSRLGPFAQEAFLQYARPNTNHWQQFASMLSDSRTICPMVEVGKKYLTPGNFMYIATHKRRTNLGNLANAGADIKAIFSLDNPRSHKDKLYSENMAELFYNFVRQGLDLRTNDSVKLLVVNDRITETEEYASCDLWTRYFQQLRGKQQL